MKKATAMFLFLLPISCSQKEDHSSTIDVKQRSSFLSECKDEDKLFFGLFCGGQAIWSYRTCVDVNQLLFDSFKNDPEISGKISECIAAKKKISFVPSCMLIKRVGLFNKWKKQIEAIKPLFEKMFESGIDTEIYDVQHIAKLVEETKDSCIADDKRTIETISGTIDEYFRGARKKITDKAQGPISQEKVSLTDTRAVAKEISKSLDDYRQAVADSSAKYAAVMEDYLKYRHMENSIIPEYANIAIQTNNATSFSELFPLTDAAWNLASREQNVLDELDIIDRLATLKKEIVEIQQTHNAMQTRNREFIDQQQLHIQDLTTIAVTSLDKALGYCDRRKYRLKTHFARIMEGIGAKRDYLVKQEQAKLTDTTTEQAKLIQMSASYVNTISKEVELLWKLPPVSPVMKFEYLQEKYIRFTAFLARKSLCSSINDNTAWMYEGCKLLQIEFGKVERYLSSTLPFLLKFDMEAMSRKGADQSTISIMRQSIAEKNYWMSVRLHDALLKSFEEN